MRRLTNKDEHESPQGLSVTVVESQYSSVCSSSVCLSSPCLVANAAPRQVDDALERQIVGRPQDDWGVLQMGHALEAAAGLNRIPEIA